MHLRSAPATLSSRAALAFVVPVALAPAHVQAQAPRQFALQAQGEGAAHILEITWVLMAGGALIFAVVMALGLYALFGPAQGKAWLARRGWLIGAGIAFPLVVLTALLVYTFGVAAQMQRANAQPAATRIEVTGELWWWRVRYLAPDGAVLLETANELRIPVGEPVDLALVSHEVIHSFWVPSLAGKLDMLPGTTNRLRLRATEAGTYRGQCAEYCGTQHAKMALHVVAQPAADHAAWLEASRRPAPAPRTPLEQQGRALFEQARCGVCHAVRGTDSEGRVGPDLTHVGARLTLAAGTLPNGGGALAAWVSDPQHIKPGSRMPGYRQFSGEELRALSAYLEGLR